LEEEEMGAPRIINIEDKDLLTRKYDLEKIRSDFPVLSRKVHGKPLVYLDNAASSQKPQVVIDAISSLYENDFSNIHRGVHFLSEQSTSLYESAREQAQKFLNAEFTEEIVFVRGATEGINLVASSYGRANIKEGDEILISTMEHHSNIVPWQILCQQTGAELKVIPMTDDGELIMEEYENLLGDRTKLVGICHVSNALGTVNPVKEIIDLAHSRGVPVLIDGAQAVPHTSVDVQELDCDFYVFSGHKVYGPTGIGILYGKKELLETMPPYQGGGDMILSVSFEKTVYNTLPYKFEAGTPNISGAVGLGVALKYIEEAGIDMIARHEANLLTYGAEILNDIPGLRMVGTAEDKAGVLSFILETVHPHDIGTILDREGIAIRTGHHCAQPVMKRLGVPATARASLGMYNTTEELDKLAMGIRKVIEVFS
jgi:cysteine desulfurase/selenocysteine lyase